MTGVRDDGNGVRAHHGTLPRWKTSLSSFIIIRSVASLSATQ